jgi:PAS domain-containing protein
MTTRLDWNQLHERQRYDMTLNVVFPRKGDESLFNDIFERNGAVQLLIDPADGSIVDANPAACEFYGYSRDVFRTLKIFQINTLPEKKSVPSWDWL